jgi:hypothetical protein
MKRAIRGCAAILGLSVLALGAPASASTTTTKAQLHVQVARCQRVVKAHGKITKANLSACKATHLQVKDHCKSAGGATVVKVNKVNYALRVGHKPVKVTSLCLTPAIVNVPPLPPTTAAPARCHPLNALNDGGNCYEAGQYCPFSDVGVTGVSGDGNTITCEKNYKWEPT